MVILCQINSLIVYYMFIVSIERTEKRRIEKRVNNLQMILCHIKAFSLLMHVWHATFLQYLHLFYWLGFSRHVSQLAEWFSISYSRKGEHLTTSEIMLFKPWTNEDIQYTLQGNYRHKMSACRFKCLCICMYLYKIETTDKHNGNENFIRLLIKSEAKKQRKNTGFMYFFRHLHTLDKQCWRLSMGNTKNMFSLFTFLSPPCFLWQFDVIKIAMWLRPNRRSSCIFSMLLENACDFFIWNFISCFRKFTQPYQTKPIIQVTFSYEKHFK